MTLRKLGYAVALLVLTGLPVRAADAYSIKTVTADAPKELDESIRKLLGDKAVQLLDAKGQVLMEVWMRKEVVAKATEAQVKNGLSLKEIPVTTLMGALRVEKQASDYRKQNIAPGVYTLRLALQPQNGDHMGTAPYDTFFLASAAAEDKKPGTMEPKALFEMSAKTTENHPAVFLVFPPDKSVKEFPRLVNKGSGQWAIFYQQDVTAAGQKTKIMLGLTLIGASASA